MTLTYDPTHGMSEPDRRWTTVNVAEAVSRVMTWLDASLFVEGSEWGTRWALSRFGVLPGSDVTVPLDMNQRLSVAAFYGRMAANVDALIALFDQVPGVDGDEFERDLFGSTSGSSPRQRERTRPRYLPIALKSPFVVALQCRRAAAVHRETADWWRREVVGGHAHTLDDGRDLLRESARRFRRAMGVHCVTRLLLQVPYGLVGRLCEEAGDATLVSSLLGGFDTEEVAAARDLTSVARGVLDLETFLERHGFHGPAEGNASSRSWREDPTPVRELLPRLAAQPAERDVEHRQQAAIDRRLVAEHTLRERLPRHKIAQLRLALGLARSLSIASERGKAAFLMGVDGVRAGARVMGSALAAAGRLEDPDDIFHLSVAEATRPLDDRTIAAIPQRKARHEHNMSVRLPQLWTGDAHPIAADAAGADGSEIRGIAASPGVHTGRAVVVNDTGLAPELRDGDILVARITDPSWMPLFLVAGAAAIDIGGAASHGAIVARELGLPCVIGTGCGTTTIRTDDVVEVDGSQGVVRVIERATSA